MWDKVIELSGDEPAKLKDILSALQCFLTRDEIEEFGHELLACNGGGSAALEPLDGGEDE